MEKGHHMPDYPGNPQRSGQEQGDSPLHQHLAHQLLLKFPVQFPGAVAGKGN